MNRQNYNAVAVNLDMVVESAGMKTFLQPSCFGLQWLFVVIFILVSYAYFIQTSGQSYTNMIK